MTPEEIKALLTELLGSTLETLKSEILTSVDVKNQGLASNLTKELKKVTTQPTQQDQPDSDGSGTDNKLTMKALQQKLKELEEGIANEKSASATERKRTAIANLVAGQKLTQPTAALKLFSAEYESAIKEEAGQFYIESEGSVLPLAKSFDSFVASNSWLIPPSGTTGSGSKEKRTTKTPASTDAPASPWLALVDTDI
jgi:hypothetical protein